MICASQNLEDYLSESEEVNFSDLMIQAKAAELLHPSQTDVEKARTAYEFVRDKISHSWDIQSKRVTCTASDVLRFKEGICYAKSHLLAALLRSQGIPAGFCYQRLMLFDTPEKGYCIHALNAIYLESLQKWVRIDARGNKEGVDAQFSLEEEKLAFHVNKELDEIDYPIIYDQPHPAIIATLKKHADAVEMYTFHLPEEL